MFLDGVGDAMREDDGAFAPGDLVEGDELLLPHQRPGAVVDEDVADVVRQLGQRGGHGILPLGAPAHKDTGGRRVGGEFDQLALVAVGHDKEVDDTAAEKRGGGMREDRFAAERREDLVGHAVAHATAAAGGEEDGGGAAHGEEGMKD